MAASVAGLLLVALATLNLADADKFREALEAKMAVHPEDQYIWGRCDPHGLGHAGCILRAGLRCASFLSEGPADADIKLLLVGLPASTPDRDVHLQWWAPRRNPWPYDLRNNVRNLKVWYMSEAYANHTDDAFNGGNVRVNESGNAIIRIRLPSTYIVDYKYILWPHVHLRLCEGENETYASSDSIFFTSDGVVTHFGFTRLGFTSMTRWSRNCTGSDCPRAIIIWMPDGSSLCTGSGCPDWEFATTRSSVPTPPPSWRGGGLLSIANRSRNCTGSDCPGANLTTILPSVTPPPRWHGGRRRNCKGSGCPGANVTNHTGISGRSPTPMFEADREKEGAHDEDREEHEDAGPSEALPTAAPALVLALYRQAAGLPTALAAAAAAAALAALALFAAGPNSRRVGRADPAEGGPVDADWAPVAGELCTWPAPASSAGCRRRGSGRRSPEDDS